MKVLVIEDDPEISSLVRRGLARDGHLVETADDGSDGLWMATEFEYDVVVLDWGIPEPDGIEVCRRLRAAGRWMAILMLTGHGDVQSRVEGLGAGADDYLTKPFAVEELRARIQAVTRRAPTERPTTIVVDDLELDPAARQVRRAGEVIELRPKEFSLLELFMRHPGQVLARSDILERAWDMNYDGMSNVVDVQVRALRNKIDKPFGAESIETIWRVGYRLRAG